MRQYTKTKQRKTVTIKDLLITRQMLGACCFSHDKVSIVAIFNKRKKELL